MNAENWWMFAFWWVFVGFAIGVVVCSWAGWPQRRRLRLFVAEIRQAQKRANCIGLDYGDRLDAWNRITEISLALRNARARLMPNEVRS